MPSCPAGDCAQTSAPEIIMIVFVARFIFAELTSSVFGGHLFRVVDHNHVEWHRMIQFVPHK
jgi:hypothetical protein